MSPQADILIQNGWVLCMDAANTVIRDGAVAIAGDRIAAVGKTGDFADWHVRTVKDARGGIILPGLINTHTHAAMTCFRGLADDLPLMEWLHEHIFPAEALLDAHKVYCGTRLACAEMLLSGTTCFCDMYLFEDAVAEAAKAAGIRAVVGEVLFDFPSPNYGAIENGFAYTRQLLEKWKDDPLISGAVEPHSPYLCAPELLQTAGAIAREYDAPLILHLAETRSEVETVQERYGRSPVGHLADLGLLGPRLIACHGVVLSPEDIELLRQSQSKVSHNPQSNMKLASGVAPVPKLLEAGVCVGLGTDGCSSNNNLDLFEEMDTAAKLHKVFSLDPTVMDAPTVLRLSTIEAARVLGLERRIGSLEPGKQADLIVVDTDSPHLTPLYDPVSHLVYAARGGDVALTMVNGRILTDDRRLTEMDAEAAMAAVRAIAKGLR